MIALDARRLAGASPLNHETFHSALRKVHRQAQADRAASDDQHLNLAAFARRMLNHKRSVRYPTIHVQNAGASPALARALSPPQPSSRRVSGISE
jgi:hypothetical protein